MAAGVGKTYAMLQEAQQHKASVDLVVGVVNTHGRKETAALLEGLPLIPPKILSYKGKSFEELDLDEVLKSQPQLVLIDELAHTNIPGSRHDKRWQDVIEILDRGIDVYTTLNVQHIESLNDIVSGITGTKVRETVPDKIIETASYIQLVDLNPEDLLRRLKEGKVYLGEQQELATQNFFQKDRLTALREIVLRYAAEKVDHDLQGIASIQEHPSEWHSRERLLVVITPGAHSQTLIRAARRLAFKLDAPWIALHVNDGTILNSQDNEALAKNISLARDLGAEVVTTNDPDIMAGIKRIVKRKEVTQVIIARSPQPSLLNLFMPHSFADTLAKECPYVDVHVIGEEPSSPFSKKLLAFSLEGLLSSYLTVVGYVGLLVGINFLLLPFIGYNAVGMVFLIGILLLSLVVKKGPIFLAATLSVLAWDFFFIRPQGTFLLHSKEDVALLVLFFLTVVVAGILIDRARERKDLLAEREESAQSLYEIIRLIASSPSIPYMIKSITERLGKILDGSFEILLKESNNKLDLEKSSNLLTDKKEKSAAVWVFEHGEEAGWSTATLPFLKNFYIPIKGFPEPVGVIVYRPRENRSLTVEEKNFIYTVGQQLSHYVERIFAEEKEQKAHMQKHEKEIYQNVYESLTSGLKNPLSSMQSALEEVQEIQWAAAADQEKKNLFDKEVHKMEKSSDKVKDILDHISVMTKLTDEVVPIKKRMHNVKKIIKDCCEKSRQIQDKFHFNLQFSKDFPDVYCDSNLIKSLFYCLIKNLLDYNSSEFQIDIDGRIEDQEVSLSFSREGSGNVSLEEEQEPERSIPGLKLELIIPKKIIEMHQGKLQTGFTPSGGIQFIVSLPRSQ